MVGVCHHLQQTPMLAGQRLIQVVLRERWGSLCGCLYLASKPNHMICNDTCLLSVVDPRGRVPYTECSPFG
jgi:hypothetical protein